MKYLEFAFHTTPCTEVVNDVLSAVLGEVGFESFVEQADGIAAYIQKDLYSENALKEALANFPLPDTQVEYTYQEAEDKDWNEEWEKNFFQPIIIGDRCVIHSTFHHDIPQVEYDIVINPQMAFGTGHHETTSLIIGELLDNNLQGKSLLNIHSRHTGTYARRRTLYSYRHRRMVRTQLTREHRIKRCRPHFRFSRRRFRTERQRTF